MKKSSSHLMYHWWKYVVVLAASVLIWMIAFDSLAAPEKNEKICISYFGENLSCEQMEEDLFQILPSLTEQKIENLSVENPIGELTADYHAVLTTRVYGADFIIIEECALEKTMGETYFLPLPLKVLAERLTIEEYYIENDVPYGILLNGRENTVFSRYYSGSENCYLFITHTSVNMAGIMGSGSKEDDAALKLIAHLLEENDG